MSKSAVAIRDDFQSFLLRMAGKFQPFPYLRQQEAELRLLADSLTKPFTLAVFGRMKTGKSSLINALVGRPLAITGVEEATATLNWISYGDASQQDTVVVHWKDGRVEPVSFSRLLEWSGKEQDVLDRVHNTSFLQLYANAERLKEIQIVDTPGTGSVADEHEEVAREFLSPRASEDSKEGGRKADALLYVFPPVARERDEESLAEFRNTRLPGSDPYNSIGVLHKWDGLESDDIATEAARKAERLKSVLGDMVCDVIPVSAPLAMVARHAPDSFLEGIMALTASPSTVDSLIKFLKRDNRWDEEEERRRVRLAYPLPWVSFVRLIHLLMERSCNSVADARTACCETSGIEKLEAALDLRFFRRAALIKQRLTRVKASNPVQGGLMILSQRINEIQSDHLHFQELALTVSGTRHAKWLNEKASVAQREHEELEAYAVEADRDWLVEKERMDLMEKDLGFLDKMGKDPNFIEARDTEAVQTLLATAYQLKEDDRLPTEVLNALLGRYQDFINAPLKQTRDHFEHLIQRITEAIQANLLHTT